ncbi:hypothetical protein RclHR1_10080002 [Rhizophagus clarus]|uniref:Uncharacterized protein n=1 Tax=Rhizophagus clarus TaxID=94130 RepID=A0A2Z6QCE1_9GLOM|nr:hypothetical protein RclHR1_10080002 [Rhizophagus clarus]GES99749.1 hypothetical protein GLOIN_2v1667018 [Rhizophagus clarus]
MNSYQEILFFPFNQQNKKFYNSTFQSIKLSRIKHYIIKKRINYEQQDLLNFIIWNLIFFSFFPFASASVAPFVDENYKSDEDLYDAFLNTLFPIFFVLLINVSGKPGPIKNIVLPLLDDLLYNMITWMIPFIVSFSYDHLLGVKIFSIINMCLHVFCALHGIIRWERVTKDEEVNIYFSKYTLYFLIFFPVIVIPTFWIVIIVTRHIYDAISIIFLTLFGICLASFVILYFIEEVFMSAIKISVPLSIICFYVPNILQTILITLNWPINFYFVKACIFILVLSLSRNVTYFTDKVPKDFLATSTTVTQCVIKYTLKRRKVSDTFKGMDEIRKIQEKMQTIEGKQVLMQTTIEGMQEEVQTIDGVQKSINGVQEDVLKIDGVQKTMKMTIDEMQRIMNEMKISMDEMNKKFDATKE